MDGQSIRRKTALPAFALLLLAALLLFSRQPSRLIDPQLWAEDGFVWLTQAYRDGPTCLAIPVVGYLQTLSRLAALFAVALPLRWAPLIFAVIAFIVQLAPVALVLSARGAAWLPSLPARLLLIGFYIGEPNADEVFVNLTNAMWHLALLAFLIIILPRPRTALGVGINCALLVLSGLSGPLVVVIAAIACWQAFSERFETGSATRLLYAGLTVICACFQLGYIFQDAAPARNGPLGASLNHLFHIVANQVLLGGTIGARGVEWMMLDGWWQHTLPPALLCLFAVVLGVVAFVRGPPAYRKFILFAGVILVSGLSSPMVSFTQPQWPVMQYPGAGTRYYVMAMLAWFATLLVLAADAEGRIGRVSPALPWIGRGLILACLIGVVLDWQVAPYADNGYAAVAQAFEAAAPGTVMKFPDHPAMFFFTLTKHAP